MRKILIILFLSTECVAQAISSDRYPELHIFNDPNYTITMEVIDKTTFKYIIDDKKTEKDVDTSFLVINNEYEAFKQAFEEMIKAGSISTKSKTEIDSEANKIYYFFKAAEIMGPNLNFKPEAGTLSLMDNLSIEEITSSDYMIQGMVKEAQKKMNYEYKRGFFREKIYKYHKRHYTKVELRNKIFNDTSAYFASEPRRVFYSKYMPDYIRFLDENEPAIAKFKKSSNELKEIELSFANLASEQKVKSEEAAKNLVEYNSYARNYWSAADANGFNLKLPNIALPSFESDRSVYKRRMIDFIVATKREIDNLQSRRIHADTLSKLAIDDDLLQLRKRKKALDSIVLKPYNDLSALADKWIMVNSILIKINNDLLEMTNQLAEKRKSLFNEQTDINTFFKRQADSLKKLQDRFATITKLPFSIKNIDLEFNEGFIENILVIGEVIPEKVKYYDSKLVKRDTVIGLSDAPVKFENRYPIGFSRKRDFENLKRKNLFTMDGNLPKYRLHLEDMLSMYYQRHEINRRDFCPADTVLRISFGTKATSKYNHVLYKEATFKILEARVFSDFVGLDRTNPNGLIQIEVEKKISLITNRYPRKVFKYEMWNFGFLSYIIPTLNVSKVEENNKELPLLYKDEVVNGQYYPQRYVSTLQLKRYENFNTGFDLNLILLDIPTFKSTFYLDYGFKYGRVSIVDSLREYNMQSNTSSLNGKVITYGVNTLQFYPRINWFVRSDERYSFNFSGSVNWYFLRANDFKQVANEEVFADFGEQGKDRRVFANVSMLATLKPNASAKGKLFFRYQYNWQLNYSNTGFHQAQVGYSFYLLSQRK